MEEYIKIKEMKSPEDYNERLDDYLRTANEIPNDLLHAFDEAYGYDTATTINWLKSKLTIIYQRIQNNELIYLQNSDKELSIEEFKILIFNRYPRIELRDFNA